MALSTTRACARPEVEEGARVRGELHAEQRIWVEKNCYVDIWIALLNALAMPPQACLGVALEVDFEGDQWTFLKPSHDELFALYGIEVQELTVWRPLLDHAREHLAAGRMISTEADAFWLPDTAGTDYRRQHTKTTIVLNDIDVEQQRLGYFHNTGYHWLEGEDFAATFRLHAAPDPTYMPLFAELLKFDRLQRRDAASWRAMARASLARHWARRAAGNPVQRFHERLRADLPALRAQGLAHYHAWAFANTRQLGAAAELVAMHLRWLNDEAGVAPNQSAVAAQREAADAFEGVAAQVKTQILKGARLVMSSKPFQEDAALTEAARLWDLGMDGLGRSL